MTHPLSEALLPEVVEQRTLKAEDETGTVKPSAFFLLRVRTKARTLYAVPAFGSTGQSSTGQSSAPQ
jgi:hypothetical protein